MEPDGVKREECEHLSCKVARIAAVKLNRWATADEDFVVAVAIVMEEMHVSVVEAYRWIVGFLTEALDTAVVEENTGDLDEELRKLTEGEGE